MSKKTTNHLTWYANNKRIDGKVAHASQSKACKHFDNLHQYFESEAINMRVGLCADGFNPFGHSNVPYSCWPILVIVCNLPP